MKEFFASILYECPRCSRRQESLTVQCLVSAVERHRKEKINAGINRIGNLLPCSQALKQVRHRPSSPFSVVQQNTYYAAKLSCIYSSVE